MSFETENRTVGDIFSRVAKYVVPRYQRAYVWDKVNWSELLNDIKFTVKYDHTNWSHFLGAIVLVNRTEQNRSKPGYVYTGINEYDIIDGQQRLTTIYILLICLYYRFNILDTDISRKRAEYLKNNFLLSQNANGSREFKIYNEDYQDEIKAIYQSVIDKELPTEDTILRSVFIFFNNELSHYGFEDLARFSEKLSDINLVEITSTQEEEIYNIFEVLNARGKKLKQMELLKNHVMKYIQPRESDVVDKAREKWNTILDSCSNLPDEDILLVHFCKCYIKKKAENADMVYKLVKDEIAFDELSKFLDDFVEYSKSYAIIASSEQRGDIEYFNIKRSQQVRSLLAAIEMIYRRNIITEDEKTISFHNLRNFFFLFNACSNTSNKTDNAIAKTAFDIYHAESELDYKFVMSKAFMDLSKFISKETVKELLFTTPSMHYSNKNSSYSRNNRLVKYILCCLYAPDQNDTILEPNKLTIEHLLNDDGSPRNSAIYNLTLTSGEINGNELKTKPIDEKIKILSDRSSIIANQKLTLYLDENKQYLEEKRKEDLKRQAIENVFCYKSSPFGFSSEAVEKYLNLKSFLCKDKELYNILLQKGVKIEEFLANNPNMGDAYTNFVSICKENNFPLTLTPEENIV